MKLVDVLETLSNACGVAGREEEIQVLMKELLKPHMDEIKEDKLGNVIGVKKGKGNTPKVMLTAHMDEIGLMVKNITKEGFIHFTKIGGIDDRILVAQKVLVHTKKGPITGVIGSKPPHILKEEEKKKVIEADKLFIDVGATSREDAQKIGLQIGDPVSFDIKFARVGNEAVVGKAFDDRVGCAALVETLARLGKADCTVFAVGTIQEEVGLRGATVAAFQLRPDVGVALDVTVAGDVPGVQEVEAPIKMRKGPSVTVTDYGLITHPKVLKWFIDAAEESKVPYQLESTSGGTTDAARIALSREGVPSGVLSIPTRYIHSPASLLSLVDLENTIKLTVTALGSVQKYF
ncbi:MAG: M42 family metallopeptidase [Candidatus Bathyarchaeota archaeon]|nr:MAG: M42 family metallopeptidase [Candidatus Bathyarchaeota archaeon]